MTTIDYQKKKYSSPELIDFGNLIEMTQNSPGGSQFDFITGSSSKT